ncbi:uncharacterized protein LOC133720661 [Rosa rugosa]|uniref:uncharacterized protein LOC133720661 n=1 Tax=Rosa rugosa TaxID=74645 RepID=UPI002B4057F1|nr:uncharacterized protein LOC133720661 [Rosa rugosa]
MASDESMTLRSCISMQEGEYDDYTDEGYDQDQPHQHLSRLSMCTSNSVYSDDQMNDDGGNGNSIYYQQGQQENGMNMYMSLLSIDSFDGDGDVDEEEESSTKKRLSSHLVLAAGMSTDDDSDTEPACYSLPATPPRLRRDLPGAGRILINKVHPNSMVDKEYASENEAQKALSDDCRRSRRRSRRRMMRNRSSWLSPPPPPFHHGAKTTPDLEEESMNMNVCGDHCHSFSGESEGTGMVVIARPKGGNRSLCMDLEEVKACKDLGFELEHDRMLQQQEMIPSRLSLSATTLDTNYTTSSGGNSPIANWAISSPGDHPQEVKARLKVWAQAVALASASPTTPTRHSS